MVTASDYNQTTRFMILHPNKRKTFRFVKFKNYPHFHIDQPTHDDWLDKLITFWLQFQVYFHVCSSDLRMGNNIALKAQTPIIPIHCIAIKINENLKQPEIKANSK